jgi:hypothetical protein
MITIEAVVVRVRDAAQAVAYSSAWTAPSSAGKSTIVAHLAQMLVAAGEQVYVTAEPSDGPIGVLCCELTESVSRAT